MIELSISNALNKAHHQLMAADDRVIILGEDIVGGAGSGSDAELGGVFGVTAGLAARFGRGRVIDTPISETAFVGMGIGAAATGLKPIIEIMFCDFMGVCFDQLMNQAAKMRFLSNDQIKLPLVIRTTMGAGDSSGAMHSQSLHGLLASIPGLKVACPSSPSDAAGLLKSALYDSNPVVIFEHKGLYGLEGPVDPSLPPVRLGKGKLARKGNAVTIVAVSAMLTRAQESANTLSKAGIEVEIIDPRTISPLDGEMILESVKKTGRLIIVDEGAAFAGFTDAVLSLVVQKGFSSLKKAPVKLTPPHTPTPYAPSLECDWLPSADDITKAVRSLVNE